MCPIFSSTGRSSLVPTGSPRADVELMSRAVSLGSLFINLIPEESIIIFSDEILLKDKFIACCHNSEISKGVKPNVASPETDKFFITSRERSFFTSLKPMYFVAVR